MTALSFTFPNVRADGKPHYTPQKKPRSPVSGERGEAGTQHASEGGNTCEPQVRTGRTGGGFERRTPADHHR
ncbi:hypothetical protein AGR1B_Cc80177 [Agrobacterium fabacearum S56]|nr:hypothetical protein AGR1B_Cc80177 [Agrobacterium fabacearum S56]